MTDRSLGYAVYDWCREFVRQPDGPNAGDPWLFTREQVRFIHAFYALDDDGRFRFHRAVLRRAKGWGKTPLMAALALAELCGPVRFGGWAADGEPVGVPASSPLVQIAGTSLEQTDNTMSMVLAMLAESPAVDVYGIDLGLTRIFTAAGGKLRPVTASDKTAEGGRPTFVVLDETHHWTATNGGHKLAQTLRRNLGKSRDGAARSVETTNAHEPGVDSVAEQSYDAFLAQEAGRARRNGLLYDAREAPPTPDLSNDAAVRAALVTAYGDSTWVDFDRILDEINDLSTPPDVARRFYLNQIVAAVDSWLSAPEWDACAEPTSVLRDGDQVTLGFDGSKTDDATALVACRVDDGLIAPVEIWQPVNRDAIDRTLVDATVAHTFNRFHVVAFYADLHPWESYVDKWALDYGDTLLMKATRLHAIAWDMRARTREFTVAAERFHDAVLERQLKHDGTSVLREHTLNARRRLNQYGVSFGKEHRESRRKVDALAAAVLARLAQQDVLASGKLTAHRSRALLTF